MLQQGFHLLFVTILTLIFNPDNYVYKRHSVKLNET